MKYFLSLFLGTWILFLLSPYSAFADVKINEIAWMGTVNSQYSEWIELYNTSNVSIPLAGWKLYKTGGELLFTLTKTITAGGYLLVERTTPSAPDAVPGIDDEAGTFGGGGLKNSGEDLALEDKEGTIIDSVAFASGWPAGDAKTKDTMQWDGQKWITAPGTPDAANAASTPSSDDTTPLPNNSPEQTTILPVTSEQTPSVQSPTVTTPIITSTTTVVPEQVGSSIPTTDSTEATSEQTLPSDTEPTTVSIPTVNTQLSPVVESKKEIPVASKAKAKNVSSTKSSQANTQVDETGETAASQLQDGSTNSDPDAPKENNHTKVIILVVVAFIGMALFLLLGRFKVSQE